MSEKAIEDVKLERAAEKLVQVVSDNLGNWIVAPRIVSYGKQSKKKRKTVYSTLEAYGFHWDESQQLWLSDTPMPDWIEPLIED